MTNKKIVVAALLIAVAAVPAQAVNVPGAAGVYAFGGGLIEIGDTGRNSAEGVGANIGLGVPIGPHRAIELGLFGLSRERNDFDETDKQLSVHASFIQDFGPMAGTLAITPFLSISFGTFEEEVIRSDITSFGGSLGMGMLIPVFENRFGIRTEARALLQSNDESIPGEDTILDYQIRIGIQIPFYPALRYKPAARLPPAPELPPPDRRAPTRDAPEPALDCAVKEVDPVTGKAECVYDADGDGVEDNLDRCPDTPGGTLVDVNGCKIQGSVDSDEDGILDDVDACPATTRGLKVDATGCIVAQTATLRAVNFESGSARLTENAKVALVGVARTLKNQKNLMVEINGHTDNVGNDDFNLALSSQRAKSVRQYLILKGVPGSRLESNGFGETQPVSDNDSEAGRLANRRVEFKVSVQ